MTTIARGTHRIALSEPIKNRISAWTMTADALLGLIFAGALLPSARAANTVTVRPREIDEVLINPGIGFTTFQRFNGVAPERRTEVDGRISHLGTIEVERVPGRIPSSPPTP